MFYVEKWHRDNKKELAIIHIGPPIIVLLAFLGITLWSWIDAKNSVEENQKEILNSHINETETAITNRLNTYEDILRAGVGLFDSSNEVNREEWKRFVEILEIDERYPGIEGVGYIKAIPASESSTIERAYRDDTYPTFSINPKDKSDVYNAVLYLEPKNTSNDRAIGYNMSSEKTRLDAINLARDTGETSVTDILSLIQDKNMPPQKGFLMFVPRYSTISTPSTVVERQEKIIGYVYAPFRTNKLISEITQEAKNNGFAYQIYAGNEKTNDPIYSSASFNNISEKNKNMASFATFKINNQTWSINGIVDTSVITKDENTRPLTILWLGTAFSIFLAIFIYVLLLNRTRAISTKDAFEIQNAKDELLALASHQLRTPATGVKQYLGLLREGYAGSLNKDQREYVNKAYESNERQLSTINEMLFVARSDAGNIKLTIRHLDIAKLIKDILDEQKSQIHEKSHKLTTNIPDHPVDLYGDEQYLRMAIENVISNSIKYTDNKGKISVSVIVAGTNIRIVVEDNGVGVDQEDLPLLFKKFSRIPNELTSKVSGSGIGLYLTKSIIKAHNGSVVFESMSNIGSSVTITLPSKLPKETGNL